VSKKRYARYIPLEEPKPVEEHDSQSLLDAVKSEFFPHEAGPWYTIQPFGTFASANDSQTERVDTDSSTAFASLAGLFAQTR